MIMEKKIYAMPLTEVTDLNLGIAVMLGTSVADDETPAPPGSHPGAPKHRTEVF